MKLEVKKALFAGGSRSIGRATARLFIAEGAQPAISDQDQKITRRGEPYTIPTPGQQRTLGFGGGARHHDLYWLHIWGQITPVEEVMRGLDDLIRQGKPD